MSLADELLKLEQLRQTGSLTAAEFTSAKAALLSGYNPSSPDEIKQLQVDTALARLDIDWKNREKELMIVGGYGNRFIPTKNLVFTRSWTIGGLGGLFIPLSIAIFVSSLQDKEVGALLFFFLGSGFVLYGFWLNSHLNKFVIQYKNAYDDYLEERERIINS